MKSFATADFWQAYAQLSPDRKEQARKAANPLEWLQNKRLCEKGFFLTFQIGLL
jgi:hypothetical protein